jgi:hypothetical protein
VDTLFCQQDAKVILVGDPGLVRFFVNTAEAPDVFGPDVPSAQRVTETPGIPVEDVAAGSGDNPRTIGRHQDQADSLAARPMLAGSFLVDAEVEERVPLRVEGAKAMPGTERNQPAVARDIQRPRLAAVHVLLPGDFSAGLNRAEGAVRGQDH